MSVFSLLQLIKIISQIMWHMARGAVIDMFHCVTLLIHLVINQILTNCGNLEVVFGYRSEIYQDRCQ